MKIRLLGPPQVVDHAGQVAAVRGHQSWAVLARILLAERPLYRRQLAAELFPDTVDPLGALRWCLAALRRALGRETLLGDPIEPRLPPGTEVDVWSLEKPDFNPDHAGELLEGADPEVAGPDFATWLLIERAHFVSRIDARLRRDTLEAISRSDWSRALLLARQSTKRNPYDEGAHILLVKVLSMSGQAKAALGHVEATEALYLRDLGEAPSPALRSAARTSVSAPPAGVDPKAVVEILIQSGTAALTAGAADAGIDCLRRAVAEAQAMGDGRLQARALTELGTALIHAVRGFDDEATVHLRCALSMAQGVRDAEFSCRALQELGYVDALAGRRPNAAALLTDALAHTGGDDSRAAGCHGLIAFNLVDWGRFDIGLASFDIAITLARKSANLKRETWALGLGAWGQLRSGDTEQAQDWALAALARSEQIGWLSFTPWVAAVLAEARLLQLRPAAAIRADLQEPFALSCQLDDPCWQGATARVIALTYMAEGNSPAALDWLARARTAVTRVTDPYAALLVEIIGDQARILAAIDSPAANAAAREFLSLAARTHADHPLQQAVALVTSLRTQS